MSETSRAGFTVVGGSGFIGSHLVRWLSRQGIPVWVPAREESMAGRSLGHVVYAAGITADFRERPLDAIKAHVSDLASLLAAAQYESLLYLSSTRVYRNSNLTTEAASFTVNPAALGDLYDLSKLMGEAACLSNPRPSVRVARLSNVYGNGDSSDAFLPSLLRQAVRSRRVLLESALSSEKDYVSVEAIVPMLVRIALGARERIYNVASGVNTSNAEIASILEGIADCQVSVRADAPEIRYPLISVQRLKDEFDFRAPALRDDLPGLVREAVESIR
jgi:nucleoside-diphosphate-sugar epimerase